MIVEAALKIKLKKKNSNNININNLQYKNYYSNKLLY